MQASVPFNYATARARVILRMANKAPIALNGHISVAARYPVQLLPRASPPPEITLEGRSMGAKTML